MIQLTLDIILKSNLIYDPYVQINLITVLHDLIQFNVIYLFELSVIQRSGFGKKREKLMRGILNQ
jgi:hypothetical protein